MRFHKLLLIGLMSLAAALSANASLAQSSGKTTDTIRSSLGVLNRVVDHTQRLISARNFARLPHEDGEFKEGVEALEAAIAAAPADFKQKVEPLIQQAQSRSHALAVASSRADAAAIGSAHEALADSVRTLIAAFPVDERPSALATLGSAK